METRRQNIQRSRSVPLGNVDVTLSRAVSVVKLLLVLASTVILTSEDHWTHNHILHLSIYVLQ
jgi:hypothetical protein